MQIEGDGATAAFAARLGLGGERERETEWPRRREGLPWGSLTERKKREKKGRKGVLFFFFF